MHVYKRELDRSVPMACTSKSIFRISVPEKISCQVPEKKHDRSSHA